MEVTKTKVIQDTVHGNIIVDVDIVKNLIDSPYFQRLRHIEQSSIRALFPTARHDRFVHSLGVFHIGDLIASHIEHEGIEDFSHKDIVAITRSYRIACLLHDIAHAPFSHTFEKYYGSETELYNRLRGNLEIEEELQPTQIKDIKQHEWGSALLIINSDLNTIIRDVFHGDIEFICRMIVGWKYPEEEIINQIKNCFIELLHGDIIDADRIDYACRDVWASGYSTATVNVQRLVKAIHIRKNPADKYVVCYSTNALSDVDNVLSVRLFQNKNVLTHHTIVYEQLLMIYAAEDMARKKFPDIEKKEEALAKIITLDAIIDHNKVEGFDFSYLCDDDLFFLMKQDKENPYFEELRGRRYTRFALWKNLSEFYHLFPMVPKDVDILESSIKEKVSEALQPLIGESELIFKEVELKTPKNLDSMWVVVNGIVKEYKDICPNFIVNPKDNNGVKFTYIYVPLIKEEEHQAYKKAIIETLSPIMQELFG